MAAEELVRLRKRMMDALDVGLVDQQFKPVFEQTLIQIYNETQRQMIRSENLAKDFEIKRAQAEAQANAFKMMGSVIYGTLNGFVSRAEADIQEIEERKRDEGEILGDQEASIDQVRIAGTIRKEGSEAFLEAISNEEPATKPEVPAQKAAAPKKTTRKKNIRKSTRKKAE